MFSPNAEYLHYGIVVYRDVFTKEMDLVNRLENSLSKSERDHFMKIAKGANLIGKLGVKQPKEDEENEKKDVDRFELLKGEYDAGNNNDKMIKELRALVIKFIHSGKINKKQGMEFLMELSLV